MRKWLLVALLTVAATVTVVLLFVRRGEKSTTAAPPTTVRAALAPGVLPRAGVYRYAQTGWEEAKAGPLKIRRTFPKTGLLVVSGSGHLVQEEWRYSKQHLEATRLLVDATGRHLTWERTRLTIVITQDDAERTRPVTLDTPAHLHVGQRWRQAYAVNGIRTVSTSVVTGRCGSGCFVVVATSTVSGAHPGTERDVSWENEQTGLTVRETIDRTIGGAFPYTMRLTVKLLGKG